MSLGNETLLPLTLLPSNRLTPPLSLACAPFSLVGWGTLRCHRGDLPYLLDSSCPEVVGYQVCVGVSPWDGGGAGQSREPYIPVVPQCPGISSLTPAVSAAITQFLLT